MNKVRRFVSAIDVVNERVGSAVLYLVPVMVLIIAYEVVARYFFNAPTIWAYETAQFVFCASIALGGGFTLLHGRHVNVDIVYGRVSRRTRAILDLITLPLLLVFVGVLLYLSVETTIDSFKYSERSATYWAPPLQPIYLAVSVGVLLMFLQGLAMWLRALIMTVVGNEQANGEAAHR
jgi:TRAP-type mannitol/chloroaromatic compound transport system permease small subunit